MAIEAAFNELRTARSPIVVISAGANRKMTAKALKQMIDKTGIPFVTTQLGKGVVDDLIMNSQELESAVRLNMHVTVVILRDVGYGMIRWKQVNMGFTDFGLDYGNLDFVKIRRSVCRQRLSSRERRSTVAAA